MFYISLSRTMLKIVGLTAGRVHDIVLLGARTLQVNNPQQASPMPQAFCTALPSTRFRIAQRCYAPIAAVHGVRVQPWPDAWRGSGKARSKRLVGILSCWSTFSATMSGADRDLG